jgi:hypothetical protein
MGILKGITIDLTTDARRRGSGTDDHLYLGIHGPNIGGFEFAIYSAQINNFEPNGSGQYYVGDIPDGVGGLNRVSTVDGTGNLNIAAAQLDLNLIDRVYIRKNSRPGHNADDAWSFRSVYVNLYGDELAQERRFITKQSLTYLGNEFGQQVWLKEQ